MSLIVSIVLARILVPDDYSVVSIVAIFFSFSSVVISGGFSSALIQKKDADELDFSSVTTLTILISAIVYLILFICAGWISEIYGKELLVPVIRVMGLVLFVDAYKSILCAHVSRRLEFKKFFISTIGGTIVSAIVGIVMALRGFGPWALVAQQMTNSVIDTLILSISTGFRPKFSVSLKRLKSLFSFGGKIYLASIITVIYDEIKPLIVGVKYSATDLAYYDKGSSFPKVLNSSISQTLSAVMFPVISKIQDDKEAVKNMARNFMQVGSYLVFPLMAGFFSVADSFVSVVLTDKWLPIVPYIRIFCVSYMLNIITTGNLQAIQAIGRSDIILKLEITKKLSYLVIIASFVFLSKTPVILAVSDIACAVLACILNSYPNRKLIGYRYRELLKDLALNLVSAVAMGLVVMSMSSLRINKLWLLVLQVLAGVVVYLLISLVTRNRNFLKLLGYAKEILGKEKAK